MEETTTKIKQRKVRYSEMDNRLRNRAVRKRGDGHRTRKRTCLGFDPRRATEREEEDGSGGARCYMSDGKWERSRSKTLERAPDG